MMNVLLFGVVQFLFVIVSSQNATLKAAAPAAATLDNYQLTGCLISCPKGYVW